jgi:hypothetical protein
MQEEEEKEEEEEEEEEEEDEEEEEEIPLSMYAITETQENHTNLSHNTINSTPTFES